MWNFDGQYLEIHHKSTWVQCPRFRKKKPTTTTTTTTNKQTKTNKQKNCRNFLRIIASKSTI